MQSGGSGGEKGKTVFALTSEVFGYGAVQGNWSPDFRFLAVGG